MNKFIQLINNKQELCVARGRKRRSFRKLKNLGVFFYFNF